MSDFRLRVFQAVARHLSFTRAAQGLFITPPASYQPRVGEAAGAALA